MGSILTVASLCDLRSFPRNFVGEAPEHFRAPTFPFSPLKNNTVTCKSKWQNTRSITCRISAMVILYIQRTGPLLKWSNAGRDNAAVVLVPSELACINHLRLFLPSAATCIFISPPCSSFLHPQLAASNAFMPWLVDHKPWWRSHHPGR